MIVGMIMGALAVILGAFGAHVMASRLEIWFADAPRRLDIWKTAIQYLMYHAIALVAVSASWPTRRPGLRLIGVCFVLGAILFSGSLLVLAVSDWSVLGMVAPLGGLCWIIGWIAAAICIAIDPSREQ